MLTNQSCKVFYTDKRHQAAKMTMIKKVKTYFQMDLFPKNWR